MKLDAETRVIADWLIRLTNNQRNLGFGPCFLYRCNGKDFKWNHKRMYRVMKAQGWLLPKSPRRSDSGRIHDGKAMVEESDQRWCSDGFQIACDNGGVVTGVFMKDCCDREIIAWLAGSDGGCPVSRCAT